MWFINCKFRKCLVTGYGDKEREKFNLISSDIIWLSNKEFYRGVRNRISGSREVLIWKESVRRNRFFGSGNDLCFESIVDFNLSGCRVRQKYFKLNNYSSGKLLNMPKTNYFLSPGCCSNSSQNRLLKLCPHNVCSRSICWEIPPICHQIQCPWSISEFEFVPYSIFNGI